MTITDAAVLIALLDPLETRHAEVSASLGSIWLPMVTTWPAFTEAMQCLYARAGEPGRDALWRLVATDRLLLAPLSRIAAERCAALMTKYADVPMDLPAASLVALAEERDERVIFTLDSNFALYRVRGRHKFERVPYTSVIPG